MTRARRAMLLVAVPVLLLIIGYGALTIVALVVRTSTTTATTLSGADRLVVDSVGPVQVMAGDGPEVRLVGRERWTWSRPSITATVLDGVARIEAECSGALELSNCAVELVVVVPAELSVRVSSSSGSVDVDGLSGAVEAESSSGEVSLSGLSGPVVARASSGGIEGTGLSGPDVDARSSAGGVDLTFVDAPNRVSATSSSGGVDVVLPAGSDPYAVTAESSAGSRTVTVPTDPGATRVVTARSSAGSVTVREATAASQ